MSCTIKRRSLVCARVSFITHLCLQPHYVRLHQSEGQTPSDALVGTTRLPSLCHDRNTHPTPHARTRTHTHTHTHHTTHSNTTQHTRHSFNEISIVITLPGSKSFQGSKIAQKLQSHFLTSKWEHMYAGCCRMVSQLPYRPSPSNRVLNNVESG